MNEPQTAQAVIGAIKMLRSEVKSLADAVRELSAANDHETVQIVVSPSVVKKDLEDGWKYVGAFGDGNYVVVEHK